MKNKHEIRKKQYFTTIHKLASAPPLQVKQCKPALSETILTERRQQETSKVNVSKQSFTVNGHR